jgi:hypothetical protein
MALRAAETRLQAESRKSAILAIELELENIKTRLSKLAPKQ